MENRPSADRVIRIIVAVLVLVCGVLYNATPFVGVDCWWHMKFAEYFWTEGRPVFHDPFAIALDQKVIATYPDLFSGTLFLTVYTLFSFTGLNILRILLFASFLAALFWSIRKSASFYLLSLLAPLLIFGMQGRVILQPDLFNYLFFTLWLYCLHKLARPSPQRRLYLLSVLFIEALWVNSHPLFFYYGLGFALLFLALEIVKLSSAPNRNGLLMRKTLLKEAAIIGLFWIIANPLGPYAFQSLLINMLDPGYTPYSCESTLDSLGYANNIALFLAVLPAIGLLRPRQPRHPGFTGLLLLSAFALAPALVYERCIPFLCIYVLVRSGIEAENQSLPDISRHRLFLVAATVIITASLVIDRFLLYSPQITSSAGLLQSYSPYKGINIDKVDYQEHLREALIVNRLAQDGNCASNTIQIESVSTWHAPGKRFFMYGHAAVINDRAPRLKKFLSALDQEWGAGFLRRYGIKTVVLCGMNKEYLANCDLFNQNLILIYMDPYLCIFTAKDCMTAEQNQRLDEFYRTFRPGPLDRQRFNPQELASQYFLLWFSATITGRDGEHYLRAIRKVVAEEEIEGWKARMAPVIAAGRRNISIPFPPLPKR